MLQTFLSKNKVSLVHNSPTLPQSHMQPSQHQFKKGNMPEQDKKVPQSEPTIPSSPPYRRRKIFELVTLSQSHQTGAFHSITLEQSKVQSYKMPEFEDKFQEPRLAVKKKKMCKENGLHLQHREKLALKKNYLKSTETLPSTLHEIMPESNQQIPNEVHSKETKGGYNVWGSPNKINCNHQQSLQSLKLFEGQPDLFTFKTDSNSSLQYSETEPYSGNLPSSKH